MVYFHHNSPEIKYVQHEVNTCVYSSLVSDIYDSIERVEENDISSTLESFLKSE